MNAADNQNPQKKKLPGSLNVLTILTFIGCGIGLLSTFGMKAFMGWSMKMMDKAIESGQEFSAKQLDQMEKGKLMYEALDKNWIIISVTSALGIGLCIWGAIQMRKLKKDGLWIYLAGEWIPVIAYAVAMGSMAFMDWSSAFGYLIRVLFTILYLVNKKHLVN